MCFWINFWCLLLTFTRECERFWGNVMCTPLSFLWFMKRALIFLSVSAIFSLVLFSSRLISHHFSALISLRSTFQLIRSHACADCYRCSVFFFLRRCVERIYWISYSNFLLAWKNWKHKHLWLAHLKPKSRKTTAFSNKKSCFAIDLFLKQY